MRRSPACILMFCGLLAGCSSTHWTTPAVIPGSVIAAQNPIFVPGNDPEFLWETVVDVVDDYFRIAHEEPVRQAGNLLTEGRLDTYPQVGATLLEPWHGDSVTWYDRLEATLQSMQRRAAVRVIPTQGGFWVEVLAFKYLEDVSKPMMTTTGGAASFHYDNTLNRVANPICEQETNLGWIPQGRDLALEQRIIDNLQWRLGELGR